MFSALILFQWVVEFNNVLVTSRKFDISPEKRWLEDEVSFWQGLFSRWLCQTSKVYDFFKKMGINGVDCGCATYFPTIEPSDRLLLCNVCNRRAVRRSHDSSSDQLTLVICCIKEMKYTIWI